MTVQRLAAPPPGESATDAVSSIGEDTEQILAAVGDAVACYDSNGILLWCNPAFDHLMQWWPNFRVTETRLSAGARQIATRNDAPLADEKQTTYIHSGEFPVPTAEFSTRAVLMPAGHAGACRRVVTVLANVAFNSSRQQLESIQQRYHLTPREREVMKLLMRGLHNADISKALSISSHTARHHTESVLDKLGVRSRAAIGALFR